MANANVNGWVESLKRHGGFGDARARQLADYFKSKDIAGDEEAQEHVAGILRRGGSLEQGGNALHSAIHSVLRRDLDIGESSAPKKKVTGTAAPASQPAEKKVAAPAPQSTPKQPAAAAKEQAAETGAEERKIDLEGKKLRLARDQEEAADRAKAKAEAAAAKEKEGKWYSKLGRGIGTGHATVKEYAGYAKSATGQSGTNIFLFFAFFIYVIDSFVTNRIGITNFSFAFKDLISLLGWTFFGILMIIHVLKLKKREGGLDIGEMVSYALALLLIFITAFSGALDRWSYVHLLFIIFFWKYVISEREDKITSNGLLIFMILIDFYFYIILKSANVNMNTIAVAMKLPYLFLFTVWYLKDRVGSKPAIIFFWVIVIVILFYNWSNLYIATTGFTTQIDGMEQINPWQVVKGVGGGIKLFLQDTKTAYAKQLEYATGGYYNSQVEQNTDPNSQLGVYIENLQAADKQFYENEQVTVWGDLKARTLDEPINIY
ncbi:MAG: hypothetical protein KKC54_04345, partial [Nanoarchaeota archaeon]|nr:hypothetical protein [Nanoarchaeota archaeon]